MDSHGTPKARPGLRFANRVYENSPLNPNKRPAGTPQTAPSRRVLGRDEPSSRGMDASVSSYSSARNIFRTSSMNSLSNPSTTPFSPSLPAETKTKVFAPGATPSSQKVFREATAQATPRGMAAPSAPVDLFTMRIPSPPPEYSGEKLARRIPRDLDGKGSVYADQFLADLVPAEYDDLQRRQLFCILDLRRLKHSANEIFAKKDWKLNITNFAKEYEKSRSLIMLRYGLYEWRGKKPDPAVMRKWRASHGLPDQEDEPSPTPTKRKNKRKAEEDLPSKDSIAATDLAASSKRRAFDKAEAPSAVPAASNKRKASVSGESDEAQPAKQHKSSATKAMFEQAFNNKAGSSPFGASKKSDSDSSAEPPASSPFGFAAKPVNGGPAESVLKAKPSAGGSGNIFGHLSDNSAQNSGQDADTESEADENEESEAQEAGQQSDEPSVVASGGADTPLPHPVGGLFGQKPLVPPETSAAASRESTPGRSLFDRVQKGNDGHPLRADSAEPGQKSGLFGEAAKPAEKPLNATWNPDTPIKFGNSTTSAGNMFAAATSTPGPLFGQKSESNGSATNLFGAPKTDEAPKDANKPAPSSLFGASKEPEKPASNLFGATSSQDKPASNMFGAPKAAETSAEPKPASALFGAPKEAEKPASSMFGSSKEPEKPAEKKPAASEESDKENDAQAQAKPLFGGFTPKPAESSGSSLFQPKQDSEPAAKPAAPAFSFGASKPEETKTPAAPTNGLFGAQDKPKEAPVLNSSTLFGSASKPGDSAASTPAPAPEPVKPALFGAGSTAAPASNMFGQGATSKPAAPTFSFGASADTAQSKPLFGSGAATNAAPSQPMFGGSPMKQDAKQDEPPAKKMFGATSEPASTGFAFGQNGSQSSAPSGGLFGASAPQSNGPTPAPSFSFGATGGQSFNNPFAPNGASPAATPAAAPAGGMFNFGGAASTTPAATGNSGTSSPFQFGGAAPTNPAPGGSPFAFGSSAPSQPAASTSTSFQFGASSTQAPSLNFTSASPQPPNPNESNIFAPNPNPPGGNMFNLQPPGGGASTTGTNSPFNFGGASSLATTPATGTPEPTADREKITGPKPDSAAPGADGAPDDNEEKPHEQISLTEGGPGEEDETVVHEVRCKVLKFTPPSKDADKDSGEEKPKSKSPWTTQGVGPFRLLKNKSSGALRMLVRAEPRGHVVLNRGLLPNVTYTADAKYVKMTTSNETGDGLETWMIQVKTPDLAKQTASILEEHKKSVGGSD